MNTDEYIKHIKQSKNKNIKVLKPMVKKIVDAIKN